MFCSYAL
jgi:hypothetical protein